MPNANDSKMQGNRSTGCLSPLTQVRDTYVCEDAIVLVTTDRQSAFDRQLAQVPFKGAVLNQVCYSIRSIAADPLMWPSCVLLSGKNCVASCLKILAGIEVSTDSAPRLLPSE